MGIDKTTQIQCSISVEDNKKYLKSLRKYADDEGFNDDSDDENKPDLLISDQPHSVDTEEYYFDEHDETIHYSGMLEGVEGKTNIFLNLPLSDTVLIDIIDHSLKKLSKLKSAMESLK